MGGEKISSAGKLLFFGSRILKSPEGKAALEPIKEQIKSTYNEGAVAETMVETSQQYVIYGCVCVLLSKAMGSIRFLLFFFFQSNGRGRIPNVSLRSREEPKVIDRWLGGSRVE
jgi:hypothetical protein